MSNISIFQLHSCLGLSIIKRFAHKFHYLLDPKKNECDLAEEDFMFLS